MYALLTKSSIFSLKSYQLEVITPEGKTYRSTEEPLHPAPIPTELNYEMITKNVVASGSGNIVEQRFFCYKISTPIVNPDSSGRSYLKWRFMGVFQFTEPIQFVELSLFVWKRSTLKILPGWIHCVLIVCKGPIVRWKNQTFG